jgi:hypothetical protein
MVRASGRPTRHSPFGHLYIRTIMMVLASVAATSFIILLLFSRASTTPFSAEGVGAGASFLYSSDTSPDIDPRSDYCTSTRTFHSMRAPSFSPSSDVPFVFSVFTLFSSPTCCPRPRSQPRADRRSSTRDGTSWSCYWPFSARVAEEDMVALATLRLSWR